MDKLKNRLILLDTKNDKAYDLTEISEVICEDFEDLDFLSSLNQIVGSLSINIIQMTATGDDGLAFFKDSAQQLWLLNHIKVKSDNALFNQLVHTIEC